MTPEVRALAERIARAHGVTYEDMMSASRLKAVTAARHAFMAELRMTYAMSTPEIGRIVGRDHTSVMHALRKCGVMQGRRVRVA
jgi:chromosomal replication initiator protein